MTQHDLAKAMGVSQSAVAQWESGRSFPSEDVVPRLEKLLDLKIEAGEGRRREALQAAAYRPLLPISGSPVPEDPELVLIDGRLSGQIPAPPQLEAVHGATALYVRGRAMEPRYFPGELVYLHPDKASNPGDFVFVVFNMPGFADPVGYIRQYVGQDLTHIHLRTLNPRKEHALHRDGFVTMHAIVGSGLF